MLILMVDDLPDTKGEYLDLQPHLIATTVDAALHHLYTKPITHLYLDNDLADRYGVEGINILHRLYWNDRVPMYVKPTTRNPPALQRMTDVLSLDLGYARNHRTGWWSK